MYTIDKDVQGTTQRTSEKKDYFCSNCKAEWTLLEVVDNGSPEGLLCHRCGHVLTRATEQNSGGHEQSTRLNEQLKFISDLLKKIDDVHIPECDFDRALAKARRVVRDATHQVAATIPVDSGINRPMAVKGLTNTGPQSISVNISTAEGASEAEKMAEVARKEKLAAQNALPAWMSNSTVTGESFAGAVGTGMAAVKNEARPDSDSKQNTVDSKTIAKMDDFFETLKAEQAAKKLQDQSDDGSEEDEDDFEDVPATENNSGFGTPSLSQSMKREPSGDLSRDDSIAEEHVHKRAKIEPTLKTEETGDDSIEDDDEDEMEFEDV